MDLSRGLGLELRNTASGVAVAALAPDSVCRDAGVRPGDVLLRVGADVVTTTDAVVATLRASRGAASVALTIVRHGNGLPEAAPPPRAGNPFAEDPFLPAPHGADVAAPAAAGEESYEDVVRAAVAMGFQESDAVRAVSEGRHDVDAVVNWILDHGGMMGDQEDADLKLARQLQNESEPRASAAGAPGNPFLGL